MAEFDKFSESYSRVLDESFVGESSATDFARQKISKAKKLTTLTELSPVALDFGCGVGLALPYIAEFFKPSRLMCADTSQACLSKVSQNFEDPIETFHLRQAFDYPNQDIDLVFLSCVLHHITVSERKFWLSEIYNAMKKGGELFIFEHNPWNPVTQHIVKSSPLDSDAILLRRSEALDLCRNVGFQQTTAGYQLVTPPNWRVTRALDYIFSGLPLGTQYWIKAVK